jgi:hypothetical protein
MIIASARTLREDGMEGREISWHPEIDIQRVWKEA